MDVLNTIRKDFPGAQTGLRIFFLRRKVGLKQKSFSMVFQALEKLSVVNIAPSALACYFRKQKAL